MSAVSGDLVVTRPRHLDDAASIELVGVAQMDEGRPQSSTALEAPRADRAALAPWTVDLAPSGAIVVAGVELHPAIARDLYARLGALLEEGERDELHMEWSRLGAWLDHHFRRGAPVSGRTIGRPSEAVRGLAIRERDDQVAVRLATYVVAFLRRRGERWEGSACQLRPTVTGHERRPMGVRIRLDHVPEARQEAPPALTGPASLSTRATPSTAPELPPWLRARRDQAMAEQAQLVDAVRAGARSLDEIAEAVRLPRETIRRHLELLVERTELQMSRAREGRRWTIAPAKRAAPTFGGGRVTRVHEGRTKPSRPTKAAKASPPPPAPRPALRSCWTCNVSMHTAADRCPRCGTAFA